MPEIERYILRDRKRERDREIERVGAWDREIYMWRQKERKRNR